MTFAPSTHPIAAPGVRHLAFLQALVFGLLALKLAFILTVGPASDEAYYWMWGRRPELSYFDHPPLHSWLLGLSHLVLGRSLFALRWLTLATTAGTLYIFYLWARRLAGARWAELFWPGAVIYLVSPTFGLLGSVAFHDHLLIFLSLASGHFFILLLAEFESSGRLRLSTLYAAAVLLGLAALTKYSAVFLGLSAVLAILAFRSYRPMLRSPHLYFAGLLAVAMQAPVAAWNLTHDFASFGFHLSDRHGGEGWLGNPSIERFWEFPVTSAILISPFLIPVFVRFFLARHEPGAERSGKRLGLFVFWLSTGTFLFVSLFDYVNFWWNLVAYILIMPFAARHMGRGFLFYGHIIYGLLVTGLLFASMAVVPLINVFGGYDWRLAPLYGWERLETSARAAMARYQPDFIASDGPELASLTGFALDMTNVTSLQARPSQYDYWFDRQAHAGEDALVVLDGHVDPATVRRYFATLTPIESIEIERFGVPVRGFHLLYGEGYLPSPVPPTPAP